jgi:hypothetical protein
MAMIKKRCRWPHMVALLTCIVCTPVVCLHLLVILIAWGGTYVDNWLDRFHIRTWKRVAKWAENRKIS